MAYLLFIYNKTDKRKQSFQDFSQNSRIYRTQIQIVNVFFWTPFSFSMAMIPESIDNIVAYMVSIVALIPSVKSRLDLQK